MLPLLPWHALADNTERRFGPSMERSLTTICRLSMCCLPAAAYQAALATQYLQREHAAQHTLQHSSSHLDLHNSSPQPAAQQQPHAAVVQTGASQACRADRQEQTQGWLVAEPLQQGRSPAKQRPVQQRQQQPEGRQQQQRQQPDVASLQQARASAAAVLPVQPKRSQNHMFWDVAPRTINPAQVRVPAISATCPLLQWARSC